MDEITLKIGGLLEGAAAQQQAVAVQLEQLQQQTRHWPRAAANVNGVAKQAVLALQEAAEAAISDAVRESLSAKPRKRGLSSKRTESRHKPLS